MTRGKPEITVPALNPSAQLNAPAKDSLFQRVIEHSVDGLIVIDADGIVRFANSAAISLFAGMTRELIGFHLGAPAIHERVEITLYDGKNTRYAEMRAVEIEWEGQKANLASLRDITERRRDAVELQKQASELSLRNDELMRFNRAAVGRELRMIELKCEVNELSRRLGQPARYRISAEEVGLPSLECSK